MADKQNMQDIFLNTCRKEKGDVTIYLVNGVKLQGVITGFDNFSVVLRRNQYSQLVYKHSIATVVPSTPISIRDERGEAQGEEAPASRRESETFSEPEFEIA